MTESTHTILITGVTKGIGLAIAQRFASAGFNVAGCARNESHVNALQKQLSDSFPQQQFLIKQVDVTSKQALTQFYNEVKSAFDSISILVNNAGVFLPGNLLEEQEGTLEKLLATNVQSAYDLTRLVVPDMVLRKQGHVFNMCSIASIQPYAHGGSYTISKFALLGLSKQLRMELRETNVKVTAIMPGATYTPSWEGAGLPQERFIPAGDIANTIFEIYHLSNSTDVEEIIIRPQLGDI